MTSPAIAGVEPLLRPEARVILGRAPAPGGFAVTLAASDDGTFDIGAPTFSPPAFVPMTPAQRQRAHLLAPHLAALNAYDDNDFARGAAAFDELAQLDRAHRDEHAFDAARGYARLGDAARAFAALQLAVDSGYRHVDRLASHSQLQSLHADSRWPLLLARLRSPPR